MTKKWIDPIERLLAADELANLRTQSEFNEMEKHPSEYQDSISEINVKSIIRWKHKDRPKNELGNIEELAQTFKEFGQQQPCIVRPYKNSSDKYELIVGERRWRAAEILQIKLKVIIKNIDDHTAALIQVIENDKRKGISDYAKGMSYADKIEKGLLKQKDLTMKLGISKQQVTRLLSYKKIPLLLFESIGDFQKVSSRTAYDLSRLGNKSKEHLSILIELSDKIRSGKFGFQRISNEINKRLTPPLLEKNGKILKGNEDNLFSWKMEKNKNISILFSKNIKPFFEKDLIKPHELIDVIKLYLGDKINESKKSPRGDFNKKRGSGKNN